MTKREFITMAMTLTDNAEFIAKGEEMLIALDKKSTSTKPTKTQIENEAIKEQIIEILSDGEPRTVGQIAEALGGIYTSQKVSALVTSLTKVANPLVTRSVTKKVAYFAIR